ncbi:hypothetical protein HY78_18365 [Rhizorhabdus wittichii DC-6]|nr:hypothetical protein HY78_18365 [Rhizorhabdus wittichii DC-6]
MQLMNIANIRLPASGGDDELMYQEEIEALSDSMARVLTDECHSLALHSYMDGRSDLDDQIWKRASELGWMAAALPERFGGMNVGPYGLEALHTALGRRAAPGPFVATLSAAQWLTEVGSEELQAEYLPLIAGGKLKVAIPVTVGSGPMLNRSGSALSGQLDMLGSADAGLIIAPVGSGQTAEAWALLKPAAGATLSPQEIWDPTREICALNCASAPMIALLPDPDENIGRRLRRHVALALAADSMGAASNISAQTIDYLKTRMQFGRPIASFQAIKHRAVDMIASIAMQRHLLAQAVESAAADSPDADMWAALAKAGATEAFAFVSGDCIQLHGGVGHTWEFDPHIYAKRARLNEVLAADNRTLRDFAATALAAITRQGRSTTELGI